MGKGGTKFCGDAIGSRTGKGSAFPTGKDRRKAMERFQETGTHPDVERAWQEQQAALHPLPATDMHRAFVFLDISIANKPQGRLVIELFDDLVPNAAAHFRNRCLPGSSTGLTGSSFYRLIPHYAIFGGQHARAGDGINIKPNSQLKAVEAGAVSVSHDGKEFAIALAKSLKLDASHQVVGRINMGKDVLETLNDLGTNADDAPYQRVTVTKCGACNRLGVHEELSTSGTPEDMATRVQEASEQARAAVLDALQEGLGQKRKASEAAAGTGASPNSAAAGGSGEQAEGRSGAAGAAGAAGSRSVKARVLDAMLGDMSGSSESDSSEGGG